MTVELIIAFLSKRKNEEFLIMAGYPEYASTMKLDQWFLIKVESLSLDTTVNLQSFQFYIANIFVR